MPKFIKFPLDFIIGDGWKSEFVKFMFMVFISSIDIIICHVVVVVVSLSSRSIWHVHMCIRYLLYFTTTTGFQKASEEREEPFLPPSVTL